MYVHSEILALSHIVYSNVSNLLLKSIRFPTNCFSNCARTSRYKAFYCRKMLLSTKSLPASDSFIM